MEPKIKSLIHNEKILKLPYAMKRYFYAENRQFFLCDIPLLHDFEVESLPPKVLIEMLDIISDPKTFIYELAIKAFNLKNMKQQMIDNKNQINLDHLSLPLSKFFLQTPNQLKRTDAIYREYEYLQYQAKCKKFDTQTLPALLVYLDSQRESIIRKTEAEKNLIDLKFYLEDSVNTLYQNVKHLWSIVHFALVKHALEEYRNLCDGRIQITHIIPTVQKNFDILLIPVHPWYRNHIQNHPTKEVIFGEFHFLDGLLVKAERRMQSGEILSSKINLAHLYPYNYNKEYFIQNERIATELTSTSIENHFIDQLDRIHLDLDQFSIPLLNYLGARFEAETKLKYEQTAENLIQVYETYIRVKMKQKGVENVQLIKMPPFYMDLE